MCVYNEKCSGKDGNEGKIFPDLRCPKCKKIACYKCGNPTRAKSGMCSTCRRPLSQRIMRSKLVRKARASGVMIYHSLGSGHFK